MINDKNKKMENGNLQLDSVPASGGSGMGLIPKILIILLAIGGVGVLGYAGYRQFAKSPTTGLTKSKGDTAPIGITGSPVESEAAFTDCNKLISEEELSRIMGSQTIYVDWLKEDVPNSKPFLNSCHFKGPEIEQIFMNSKTKMPAYQGETTMHRNNVDAHFKAFDPATSQTLKLGYSIMESTAEIGKKTTVFGLNLGRGVVPLVKELSGQDLNPKNVPKEFKQAPPAFFVQFIDDDINAYAMVKISSARQDVTDLEGYRIETVAKLKAIAIEMEKNIK